MRDDFQFNVELCELIEQYPALYDYQRSDYCNRNEVWETIARKLNETPIDCKERWRNIRNRYAKYKKSKSLSGPATKRVKEYYLASHLHFLDNYMKLKTQKSKKSRPMAGSDDTTNSSSDELPLLPSNTPPPFSNPSSIMEGLNKNDITRRVKANDLEKSDSLDADMSFLQSMLPDMQVMTLAQKRKFKMGIMQLANEILAENIPHNPYE